MILMKTNQWGGPVYSQLFFQWQKATYSEKLLVKGCPPVVFRLVTLCPCVQRRRGLQMYNRICGPFERFLPSMRKDQREGNTNESLMFVHYNKFPDLQEQNCMRGGKMECLSLHFPPFSISTCIKIIPRIEFHALFWP